MIKRVFDIVVIGVMAPVLLVLVVIVASAVRFALGSPVLYSQLRPGKNGYLFRMFKFRTMTNQTDLEGNLLSDEVRLTKFGRWLRGTSLDELPGLFSVLVGDMSLVGPRPLLPQYLSFYSPRQARRHEVRPGITGWAQINGRNSLSWEDKFELDVWYVDHQSFWLDLKILLMTVKKVVLREGISAQGEATMPVFRGSDSSAADQGSNRDA